MVDDKKANIIGRNISSQIGIKVILQEHKQNVQVIREQEESDPAIKPWVKDNFQQLCARIGKSKNHTMKTQFIKDSVPIQQKGPLIKKTEAIEKLSAPKTFKQLKSFMGSIHHLTRYIPNLAQAATALRPLLKHTEKKKPLDWSTEHNTAFKIILKLVAEITQNKHFDQQLETRLVCDASNTGLGVALEQNSPEGWIAVAYASRFLNSLEEKYSVNELELLGVVWPIEQFKYYLYGKHFTVITYHQALISALNASERSKTSQSRLTF